MAAPSRRTGAAPWPAFLCMLIGSLVLAGGAVWQLDRLARAHQPEEVLYSVSPRTLQAWINSIDADEQASATRLADRLLLMTLPQRRDAVLAMSRQQFFSALSPTFNGQRRLQAFALTATRQALSRAPAPGDLWFLAGRLHSQIYGVDTTAQRYIELSYLYAPREVDIVLARLDAMALAWPLLAEPTREIVRRDMAVVEQAYPTRADELKTFLANAGAQL